MSVHLGLHQLQQDLQNELAESNQLLYLISKELKQIKDFTGPGGKFEENIRDVTSITRETMKNFMISDKNLKNKPHNKRTGKQSSR